MSGPSRHRYQAAHGGLRTTRPESGRVRRVGKAVWRVTAQAPVHPLDSIAPAASRHYSRQLMRKAHKTVYRAMQG